jgi:ribosomal protein S18 acetylase RimI-like enzyme
MTFIVEQVKNLRDLDISRLVSESEAEGYRFLSRLVKEYMNGSNTFNKPGEALFCIRNNAGEVVAIGGVNQSPVSDRAEVARLRRFYVLSSARRQGVGSILLKELVNHSSGKFSEMTLKTESSNADAFYRANGFITDDSSAATTHIMTLG